MRIIHKPAISVLSFKAMGSPCKLHLYLTQKQADTVPQAALNRVLALEKKYSRYRCDSVTTTINHAAGSGQGIRVDTETAALLDYANEAFAQSDGLFDITSGVLRRIWDFKSGVLPCQEKITQTLGLVGWQKLRWRNPYIELPEGMELDFGGYVKEYAADTLAVFCMEKGVKHGLIDLGGDIRVIGPHPNGKPWKIGIRNPDNPEKAIAHIDSTGGGVATSGNYERCMIVDGRRYGHVLNPLTGWPVRGLASVTVQADQCLIAGTLSTITMLKGRPEGSIWLQDMDLPNLIIEEHDPGPEA
ncbi:MAG TPA: FAD:protein FMN transferase [Gammaproteobacteria bacterium]|nr:FAD:protein FMN transferase [Gammaproteobacteria bacterium]